jgi:Tetratricopeptide repeat
VAADRGGTAIGTLAYQRGPVVASLPVRLAPGPTVLVGREQLLADIDARFSANLGSGGPRIVALCGLGGAGKTSMAVEYARRLLSDVWMCWQFAAEDSTVLAAQFGMLAAQLGAREVVDARDPVATVHAVLARAQSKWLLIFDNAPDLESVQAFLPPVGQGRVLITSQSQYWPAGWAVQVPELDQKTAVQFLTGRAGEGDLGAAQELAAELGGLPLALEQAVAYMQGTGTTLGRYLELFRVRQADLLARGVAPGHRQHVAATLGLAISSLAEESPQSAALSQLLAFLAPEPVPLAVLLASRDAAEELDREAAAVLRELPGDPVAAGDAVAELQRYSLAASAGDGLVRVHRLVQAVTRAQLTAPQVGLWRGAAAALTEAAIPADGRLPGAWAACAALLPHARSVLDLTSSGIWQVARSLGYSGSYAAARDLCALIAKAHRDSGDYGPEHPRTLEARAYLAFWTGQAGDTAAARDQYAALVPVDERVLGQEHPETLIVRSNIASLTGRTGDALGARAQYAALLPVYERVQGPEHPDTLTTRGDLAYWTGQTGDAAGARALYSALLPVCERVQGPEHPTTLAIRAHLGCHTPGLL